MPTQEEMIAAGFNAGYLMQQHEPELLEQILKSNNQDSPYLSAMAAGKDTQQEQHKKSEREKAKEKIIKQQQEIREKQKTKKRGR